MENRYQITAIAPTVYQLTALRRFHLDYTVKTMGGQFCSWSSFEDESDALCYLIDIAENYFEEELQLKEEMHNLYIYGYLTIDGVTARIEDCEDNDDIYEVI